ncbi:MAG: type I-B CRISPR-associated protein Cas8b1/Cst1 [Candidatus Altiarchaeales archaeon HGW-Altiarchaeales-1]|nr:MAG: type I-B CRISPR-associated protein Cas8b1/Cst1 [Candidatus Altiarchaeales archaeon HGW-Altiarchaeales-1]
MENIIYKFTGDPFVDAGIWAICGWVGKTKPEELDKEDLKKITGDIVQLYLTEKWAKSLFSIFPNNPITNPSVKDKKTRYSNYLNGLIGYINKMPAEATGNCISCGHRDVKEIRTKTDIPLIGSGTMINFFPSGQSGGDYCPACTFAVQFSPLVLYRCGKLLLVHSNSDKIMRYWSKKAIKDVRRQTLMKGYTGCFNEYFTNPINALFNIIESMIREYDENWLNENPSINLYHFTNYNQGPDIDTYHVPTPIFMFLAYVKQHERYDDWKKIVKKGYKKVDWDKVKEEDEYKNKTNLVYNNLLKNKSIIGYFLNRKNREIIGDWNLFIFYLKEVKKMDPKRLETLKRVGDELSEYIKSTDNTKRLSDLERVKNYGSFRNILRKIIKDRINNADKPMFSLEEYVEYLFPDGYLSWRETQDLLLFRIYEDLHDWLKNKELPENEVEEEISDDKN